MTSKYQVIIQDILSGIEEGRFTRGQKLPSIRQLSRQYHCSKDTVQKAMLELKYQNVLYAVEKSGYYILEDKDFQEQKLQLDPNDFQQLPYEDFRTCLNESLIGREDYLFNYYHQQEGLEELIHSVHQLLMDYDVYCKKEQIVITAGTQQALYILSRMDFPNQGTDILLEEPTYHRMRTLVEEQHLPFQTIERTLNGIDLKALESLFQTGTIKFFYTIPRLHNPLGTTYSLEEKKEILRLAQQYEVYIIEDDYLADFDKSKSLPLHYLDTQDRVIYIKSFTTTLFPALRIGGVCLPPSLMEPFLKDKGLIDYDTNLIMQMALSLYIDNGMFTRNTRLLQEKQSLVKEKIAGLLEQYPLAIPYQMASETLVLQLKPQQLTARFKHGLTSAQFIESKQYTYLILSYDEDLEHNLQWISQQES